jgi:hypothetical protein
LRPRLSPGLPFSAVFNFFVRDPRLPVAGVADPSGFEEMLGKTLKLLGKCLKKLERYLKKCLKTPEKCLKNA